MEHMKHSTSRDFRINVAALTEALDNQSSTDEDLSDSDNDQNDNTVQENGDNEVSRCGFIVYFDFQKNLNPR